MFFLQHGQRFSIRANLFQCSHPLMQCQPLHHQWSVLVCNATNNNDLHFSIVKIFGFVYATAASTCSCSPIRA